jgi:biopolymer transport protein ExbD
MKPFLRRKTLSAGLDITPLMDIVFQLLLFFILSSAFLEPGLPLELPDSLRENERTESDMVISIDADGRIFINDVPASREAVEAAVFVLAREKPGAGVILRGDKRVRYGGFFEVLDIIRNAGITKISLAYENQES